MQQSKSSEAVNSGGMLKLLLLRNLWNYHL